MASRGLLRIANASQAALHFSALVTVGLAGYYGSEAPSEERITTTVIAGVNAFLNGYTASRPAAVRL